MNERTAEATTTVDEDGIRVEKSFTDDAFPVPAVMYDLVSTREDPVRVRIVDRIPESFPMDRIGFHPDYESENWTAYKDHRVEFERVLEPGESVETVFGIRDDDPDLEAFLGTPVIEHVPVGEEIEDVLGTGETDAVREVLSGDRATLPGMERAVDETGDRDGVHERDELADESEHVDQDGSASKDEDVPTPRAVGSGTVSAVTRRDDTSDTESEEADMPTEDGAAEPDVPSGDEPGAATGRDDPTAETPGDTIASALAEEIRSGAVDDADLAVLRSELDVGDVPRSVDVRISRLQSSVADIEAYADALAEFIDEEGTAREILDGLDERVADVETELGSVEDRVSAGERAHGELAGDVERVEGSVEEMSATVDDVEGSVDAVSGEVTTLHEDVDGVRSTVERVETDVSEIEETVHETKETVGGVVEDVAGVESDLSALDDTVDDLGDDIETLYESVDDAAAAADRADGRVDDVEGRLGRLDEEFDDVWDDLAEVDTRLTDIEGRLGDDLEDVDAELAEIQDHLEELDAFRKRLNEAFGP